MGVCDHIAIPDNEYAAHMSTTWYDPIATLSYLGAATSTIRLLSEVYVLPYRHPLTTANSFCTLDHLTGGRALMGVGAGHVEAEFEALGLNFADRGRMTDEAIDAVRVAVGAAGGFCEFSGEFFDFKDVGVGPARRRTPSPFGSEAALARPCAGWWSGATAGFPRARPGRPWPSRLTTCGPMPTLWGAISMKWTSAGWPGRLRRRPSRGALCTGMAVYRRLS